MDKILYIAACSPEGGVYAYRLKTDGRLEFLHKTPCDRPMYLAHADNKMYVLLLDSEESRLVRYTAARGGVLENPEDLGGTKGKCACHLAVDGERVYITNYLTGNVVSVPGNAVQQTGSGPNKARQESSHTHFVCVSPENQYILAVNLGNDTIYTYTKDLQEVSRAHVESGQGCRHLAFSPDGKLCYCANELGNTVTVFGYADGVLTPKETYSTLPSDFAGQNTVAAIRVHNGFVYVSNRGHDSVAAFEICGDTLKRRSITKTGGKSPRDFDIFGNYMVVTNESSDSCTLFSVAGERLTKLETELLMPCPLCVIE